MKWSKIVGLILAAGAFFGCKKNITIEDLRKFAATESYPTDNFLDTVRVNAHSSLLPTTMMIALWQEL